MTQVRPKSRKSILADTLVIRISLLKWYSFRYLVIIRVEEDLGELPDQLLLRMGRNSPRILGIEWGGNVLSERNVLDYGYSGLVALL